MDLDVILRLEEKIDTLLQRKGELEEECRRLLADREGYMAERERLRHELDRILAKLDCIGRKNS